MPERLEFRLTPALNVNFYFYSPSVDSFQIMDDRNVILANFQACTAIDDYSVCLAILEQHNWDLQNAVNAVLTQVRLL